MAADFGLNPVLIQDSQLQQMIDDLGSCLKDSGLEIDMNTEKPGMGALVKTIIRSFEKGITTPYEPLIGLVSAVTEALKAGIEAPAEFAGKVAALVSAISDLLANLPMSVVEFIISKLLKPFDFLMVPIPSGDAIIDIIVNTLTLTDIDWKKWLDEAKLLIPDTLQALGQEIIDQVMQLLNIPIDGFGKLLTDLIPYVKIIGIIFLPIKFAIGLIKAVVDIVKDLTTDIIAAVNKLTEIASDPVGFVLGMIGDILGPVIAEIAKSFAPPVVDISGIAAGVQAFFDRIFKIGAPKLTIDELMDMAVSYPGFDKIISFLLLVQCIIKWMIGLLKPETILGLFFPAGVPSQPPFKVLGYVASSKALKLDNEKADPSKAFKVGNQIEFFHADLGTKLTAEILSASGDTIILKTDPSNGTDDETGEGEAK